MSGRKGGWKRAASPGAAVLTPRWHCSGSSLSRRASPSAAGGSRAALSAASSAPSSVPALLSVPAPGPVHSAGGATYVVLPELMAVIARKLLHVPELPPPSDMVSAYLIHWAMDGDGDRFCVAEAVTRIPLLQEHLPLSAKEYQELRLCMSRYCCPAYPSVYTNESL